VAKKVHERKAVNEDFSGKPDHAAMMGWMMLHGFCSLLISGLLQSAEGLDTEQLKEMFLHFYNQGDGKDCSE